MNSNASIIINLPKQEKERLSRLALRYGLALPEFSKKVLEELTSEFPRESFQDYEKPKALHASFSRALCDYHLRTIRAGP